MAPPAVRDGDHRYPWLSWPQGWSAWRNRHQLADHVVVEDNEHRHAAETPDDGVIATAGTAHGCFACASTPGRVWRLSPNGEGLMPVPCPVCRKENG